MSDCMWSMKYKQNKKQMSDCMWSMKYKQHKKKLKYKSLQILMKKNEAPMGSQSLV